jgi:hypothetical protein
MLRAAPFVTYSTCSEATVNAAAWPALYAALQAFKAHVQEYPGCQSFDVFFAAERDEVVRIHCYTTWDTMVQVEAFLEAGYTFERLLDDLDEEIALERSLVMEKVF